MHSPTDSMSLKKLLSLSLVLILIWGSAYTMVDVGVLYISPIWLVAYRLILGASLVTLYMLYKGHRFPALNDKRWLWYFGLGMTGSVVPFFMLSTGQINVDSGLTAILVGVMPLVTIVLAHFFTEEKLNGQKLLGFVIGFLGVVVLFLPKDLSFNLVGNWPSQLLILGAASLYAVTTVAAKRAPETPAAVGAAMMLICAASVGIIWALCTGYDAALPAQGSGLTTLLVVIGLGVGSTAIATILYLYVITETGPSVMARINYFVPLASVGFGVWLLKEELSWNIFAAFFIIAIGVAISQRAQRAETKAALNMAAAE